MTLLLKFAFSCISTGSSFPITSIKSKPSHTALFICLVISRFLSDEVLLGFCIAFLANLSLQALKALAHTFS
ncbi:MAG: hypothetical protein LBC61_04820 [Candidatus Peribacteria bacterium]|nr:hypothetical protein [Candidatus Peribacteria bacterium]